MIKAFLNKIIPSKKSKVLVLMYHRIASPDTDPWQLSVSPENFEQHLKILKEKYNVISVPELVFQLANNKIDSDSVCITFDDAYCDNFLYAKPLLEKYQLPAAFFVVTDYIDANKEFWWDELENIILHSATLPSLLNLNIANEPFEFSFDRNTLSTDDQQKHKLWVWFEDAPTQRCTLYLEIWKRLQPLTTSDIEQVIKRLREWANYKSIPNEELVAMNSNKLKQMFDSPSVTIGIHTLTHPALAFQSKEIQIQEISGSKRYLEEISGREIDIISYPYGKYNDNTLEVVKELNLSAGFTTESELVYESSERFKLGRFQVTNQGGSHFELLLREWTTRI